MTHYNVSFGRLGAVTILRQDGHTATLQGDEAEGLITRLCAVDRDQWQPILAAYDGVLSPPRLRVVE